MCGIVGFIGPNPPVPIIIEGLRRLEYRGYDSAGIAIAGGPDHKMHLRRAPGKLCNLEAVLVDRPLQGSFGIGHTRWATHGRPTEENFHRSAMAPVGMVAVVSINTIWKRNRAKILTS